MTSDRKRRANRRNARNSTGPRSVAGKRRSSRNAFRHGLSIDDTWQPEVSAWIEKVAHLIAGTLASEPVLLAAARAIAAVQHQLNRVQNARIAILSSEAYPRTRHRLRPSASEKLLIFAALESRLLERSEAKVKAKYRPFEEWPDYARLGLALMIRRLTDENNVKQFWLKTVISELSKLDRYEQRALNQRLAAVRTFDALTEARNICATDGVIGNASHHT